MGNALSSLFSGGISQSEPLTPLPQREESPEEETTRDAERRRLRAKTGGVRSTLLTSPAMANAQNLLGIGGGI